MKKMKLLACTILMMIFMGMNAACVFANTAGISGHLDSVVGNAVATGSGIPKILKQKRP